MSQSSVASVLLCLYMHYPKSLSRNLLQLQIQNIVLCYLGKKPVFSENVVREKKSPFFLGNQLCITKRIVYSLDIFHFTLKS